MKRAHLAAIALAPLARSDNARRGSPAPPKPLTEGLPCSRRPSVSLRGSVRRPATALREQTRLAVITLALVAGFGGDAGAVAQDPSTTVAVLDFINRSPGDGRDWLGKGLADMVITDLSASDKLTVVDRERMQQLAREHELVMSGIADENTAPAVGRIAEVAWVLQGTFAYQGSDVTIEALLVDITKQRVLRIERVVGPLDDVFELEGQLVGRVLDNLDAPMSAAELRSVRLLKTQSLPAFEHYSRSLARFDNGEWYAALQEARLAQRADPEYLMAAARVAQLYEGVGEREHALIEYLRLVGQDDQNALPEIVYFRMAVLLDEAMADRDAAAGILGRILERYRDDLAPFDVTVPSRLSSGWDDVGGMAAVTRIARQNETRLRTLTRLAHWQEEARDEFGAAQLRSRMRRFMYTHGMPRGHESLHFGSTKVGPSHTDSGYWNMVRENRDRTLYPGTICVIAPGETVDVRTKPTHGYFKWSTYRFWLAPSDYEIASVKYRVGGPHVGRPDPRRPLDPNAPVQIDIFSADGNHSQLFEIVKVNPDGEWDEMKLEKGIRAIKTHAFHDERWQMRFELRPWTEPAEVPQIGSFQVNVLPEGAELFRDGKSRGHVKQGRAYLRIPTGEYTVEARWHDGRRRSKVFQIEQGRRIQFCLNADVQTVSRKIVAPRGSYPCLLADRSGRFWLVWDEYRPDRYTNNNKESSLHCATSSDGTEWSRPRRLPVSSLGCDFAPILQQNRHGVYWLVWISDRGSEAEKNLWIASSANGVEWSFPRKVALPKEVLRHLSDWRGSRNPRIAFTIDSKNTFWLVWHAWLLRSDDAVTWQVDCELRTEKESPDHTMSGKHYHLSCDASRRLLLLTNRFNSGLGAELWRRSHLGTWESIDCITDTRTQHPGNAASRDDGSILVVTPHGSDLQVHEISTEGNRPAPATVETYLILPFHPTIAPLADNRWLVAFGSTEGIVAAIFRKDG